ncbi:TPA: hypothetical protein DIU27_00200 [Candidatus Collierbacteria bacterium]|uniref:Uncharacterized protein n=1 Tax=Candidatus Collierbacteria bacterium GW2011_GWB2_44_22 TaxID=1618387 RepID=A0A0G1HZ22_9BACT|nr:MAG: hypothetical protein UW31_C0004G0012 [Candidatus Collierbacteria bacterium GW2011_GWA2_44_13]KKT51410.1 MAG: hypothetical protein UW42_C0003G0023 [Candidatus Collierbacteria bacterium GW2011_GWB1_44_197]KKT52416.1 MAG: hypothetical protein UW44_C0002G0082 [Candidatus Collierbacteria bacterium GW2011_GWB2_44_22]KKT62868.1 MAG: hypothetical protein UW56_C0003G0054 [Candidatus Collierbacteria bacterium GW2011_GWD1_44_27]KKT66267.1 MAG: hypothetical protein UW58_C0011G0038 [Candidatus Colli
MKITILRGVPLSDENLRILDSFFSVIDKVVGLGQYHMGFTTAKIKDGVLYWKKKDSGYLAFDSIFRCMYEVDDNLNRLGENFSIDFEDLILLTEVLGICLANAETGVFSTSRRLIRSLNTLVYSIRNLFPGVKHYQGYPQTEAYILLDRSLIFIARKVIEAGEEAMQLLRSKIIEGRLFLFQGDDYLVIHPDGPKFGSSEIMRSPTLNITDCVPGFISRESDVRKLRDEFLVWLSEAGL